VQVPLTEAPGASVDVSPQRARSRRSRVGRSAGRIAALAGGALAALALASPATSGAAVTAPHFINVFPSRDFVHIEGYTPGDEVTVTVHHDPALITSLSNAGQDASATGTVGSDGIFEVNHVGGTCWSGFTPDIRPGDTVSVKDANGVVLDDMVVQNVDGGRPVKTAADTIEIHGTATNSDGSTPDVALLSSRLISPTRFFANGGKRNLNAPLLRYDVAGSPAWTATYAGLTSADMTTALSADTSAMWTITDAAGNPTESTSQETGGNAIAGPTTGCSARLEKVQVTGSETVPPTAATNVKADASLNTVSLDWTAATDNTGVVSYEVLRDDVNDAAGPVPVGTVQNADASAPAPTKWIDFNVAPGDYTYTVVATDAANNDGPASAASNQVTTVPAPANEPQVLVNDPPANGHSIIGFPARDFVSADGYTDAATVDVRVIRNGNVVGSAADVVPQAPTGLVEVNHPGGGCWTGATPYLSPGDVIETIAKDASGTPTVIDRTTLQNVTAERPVQTGPGTVVIHGTATAADGGQIPVDQIENRLVTSTANAFAVNGKRTIRAASAPGTQIQGTLSYDSATSNRWTAKYTGLSADDVTRALGAESRGMWLGRDPAAVVPVESTIFENGDAVGGGPGAPCTGQAAPQPKVAFSASALAFGQVDVLDPANGSVTKPVTVTNNGEQPLKVDHAYVAGVDASSFTVTSSSCDGATVAPGATCVVQVTFDPSNTGPTSASLNLADNAKIIGFQNIPLSGTGTAGKATVNPTSLAFNTVTAGSPVTKPLTVTNGGDAALDLKEDITGATSDYTIVSAPCPQLAPGASCTIMVQFNPTAIGSRTATLSFLNDVGTKTQVPLSGTGAGSTFVVSPNPVTFGTFGINTTKSQTVGVRNSGTISFKVTRAVITGDATGAYTIPAGQACIGTVLAAGKSCNITVNLRPTAARFYSGTLEVTGDASSLPATVKTALTGTGK
jgi:centrosomal CEP192-like protein/HYDIN/CFA65/VesB family protein